MFMESPEGIRNGPAAFSVTFDRNTSDGSYEVS